MAVKDARGLKMVIVAESFKGLDLGGVIFASPCNDGTHSRADNAVASRALKDIDKLRRDGKSITEAAAKGLQKSVSLAREYIVIPVYSHECELRTESFPVYLDSKTCPCKRWTYSGVPCAHAVAAISFAGGDYVDCVDDYLKVDAFEITYARGIHAMSTVIVTEDDHLPHVGPPNTRRPPGRPHNIEIARKRVPCGRCHKQLGHNASTCTEPLEE
ncbi:hypothetical protein V1509DRAFT_634789 [Lipomyces kononenkoae]